MGPVRKASITFAAVTLTALSFAAAQAIPASAAIGLKGPASADITNYCQSLPGGTGAAVVAPGDAYSYRCDVSGQLVSIDMRKLCQWLNPDQPAAMVYDHVDLPYLDHPDGSHTGWGCFVLQSPLAPGGVSTGNPFQLTAALIGKYCVGAPLDGQVKLVSPYHANDWWCLDQAGNLFGNRILMDVACGDAAYSVGRGINWADRAINAYDGNSIWCYQ
jgi:hypothetical protein